MVVCIDCSTQKPVVGLTFASIGLHVAKPEWVVQLAPAKLTIGLIAGGSCRGAFERFQMIRLQMATKVHLTVDHST